MIVAFSLHLCYYFQNQVKAFTIFFPLYSVLTYATGRERKEDGKPRVTSMTIILFEITLRQTSLSFKQMFLQRPQNINVK